VINLGNRFAILGLFVCVVLVSGVFLGIGLPIPVAVSLAFAVVVEVGAIVGIIKLYRLINVRATVALRRRLAQRRGWRYVAQAEVSVPGPVSTKVIKGVPNNASSTTGRDVVYATVNGFNVTMFDRVRPNEPNVQSVWLVQLPMALPYLRLPLDKRLEAVLGFAKLLPPDTADADENFARALLTPQVSYEFIQLVGVSWIENWYLCVVKETGRTGSKAAEVERRIDGYTALVAKLPWPALAPFARQVPN
jgi:hypothetical protein